MRDHFELLLSTEPAANLSAAEANRLVKQANKLLLALLKAATLDAVRALPEAVRRELEGRLDVSFTLPELKAISRAWEPRRKIDDGETQTALGQNLTSLMHGQREPYVPVEARLTLKAAKERPMVERAAIVSKLRDWAPKTDVKKLVKKWDGHNNAIQSAPRGRQVDHLAKLLEGQSEPIPKPAKQ